MALKVNTEMKLTHRFISEIGVGDTIFTNGDGSIITPEFFEATVISKEDTLLLLKRTDGETGGGPDGAWIVRYTPENRTKVYIPAAIEGTAYSASNLRLGDVFTYAHPASEHRGKKLIYLKRTERSTILCVPQGLSMHISNIVTISVAEVKDVTYYGKKPFMSCSVHSCNKPGTAVTTHPSIACFCETHRPDDLVECPDCGASIRHVYSVAWITNQRAGTAIRLCSPCADARRTASLVIQSHSFKPVPKFIRVAPMTDDLRSKLFAGCECEVECPGYEGDDDVLYDEDDNPIPAPQPRRSRNRIDDPRGHKMRLAKVIYNRFNKPVKWFYLKNDGSLSNGFELVTEPATIEAHQKMLPWKKVFDFMKTQKITSDTTETCGLHIHVNKGDMDEAHRIRLGYFVNSQRAKMEAMARRSASEYARFKPTNSPMEHYSQNTMGGKYEALNWSPPHTVEFRLFKGTIDYTNLMSSLELAEACILFSANAEIEELKKKQQSWTKFKDFVLHNGFVYLPDYMIKREVA